MEKLQQNKLLRNLKTCTFLQRELVYFGFLIAENELKMDPEKIAAIINWPSPKSLFEVHSFHGLVKFLSQNYKEFQRDLCTYVGYYKEGKSAFSLDQGSRENISATEGEDHRKTNHEIARF